MENRTVNKVIRESLPCYYCGYDLHTMETHGRCPECNQPVLISTEQSVALLPKTELRRIRQGFTVFLVGGLGLVLCGALTTASTELFLPASAPTALRFLLKLALMANWVLCCLAFAFVAKTTRAREPGASLVLLTTSVIGGLGGIGLLTDVAPAKWEAIFALVATSFISLFLCAIVCLVACLAPRLRLQLPNMRLKMLGPTFLVLHSAMVYLGVVGEQKGLLRGVEYFVGSILIQYAIVYSIIVRVRIRIGRMVPMHDEGV